MMQKPILVFDYDGTIHETFYIYKPAVLEAARWLSGKLGRKVVTPDDARLKSWLGMNIPQMWEDFMPSLPMELREEGGRRVGQFMDAALREHAARWYPGAEESLKALYECGYHMVILSNSARAYAKRNWALFGMERFFHAFIECESFGNIPKRDIFQLLVKDYAKVLSTVPVKRDIYQNRSAEQIRVLLKKVPETNRAALTAPSETGAHVIMIGDRRSDFDAAKVAGAPFIGCRYGYGSEEELAGADRIIDTAGQLAEAAEAHTF